MAHTPSNELVVGCQHIDFADGDEESEAATSELLWIARMGGDDGVASDCGRCMVV